jgi:hypothetical protein
VTNTAPPSLSEIKFPTFDLDVVFARRTAGLATLREVQNVLVETTQAVVRAHYGWFEESVAGARTALAESRVVAEKAFAVTKQSIELAVAAQRRVGALLVQSGQDNMAALELPAAA